MGYSFKEIDEFRRQYGVYYKTLEDDFLVTERYLSIEKDNDLAFSNEFVKLLQAICSEIDVLSKYLCSILSPGFKGTTFPEYCKCILDANPLFVRANVVVTKAQWVMLAPWSEWSYKEKTGRHGKPSRIQATNPEWWTKYNKVKHSRTTIDEESGKAFYKFANQKNTLNALAALFILNSYILNFICKDIKKEDAEYFLGVWYNSSNLFTSFMVVNI